MYGNDLTLVSSGAMEARSSDEKPEKFLYVKLKMDIFVVLQSGEGYVVQSEPYHSGNTKFN